MEKIKKNAFAIFLIINFIAWTCIQCLRNVISIDAMEAISWGEVVDFGTNKHPPFSGWIIGGLYNICGQHDIVAYILGQVFILIGYIFIYKLAKFFLSEEKAVCASIILSSCYYYTYILFIDNFNCNFVSMALWPMICYYFYKATREEKTLDWIIFGIASAIAVLTKYQVAFLFLALFIYLIAFERKQFTKKGMYISVLCGFLVILPHIIWLFNNDFFSLIYISERTEIGTHNTPELLVKFGRLFFPLKFTLDQLLSITPGIILYGFLAFQAKNISYVKDGLSKAEKWFILLITFAPMLAQGSMAFFTDNRVQGIWGSIMVSFTGILMFSLFPIKFKEDTFKYFMKWAYSLVALWLIGMVIFSQLQTKRTLSYPYQTIMPYFNDLWDKETNNAPFKYVGGHIDYVFQFHVYNKRHPKAILETFGHKNPWINPKDVLNSGILVVGGNEDELPSRVHEMSPLLPEDYKIEPQKYSFKIKNKLNKTKEYSFVYTIIPPQRND